MQISPNLLEQKGKNEKQIAKGCCWRLNAVTVSDKQCLKRKMIITPEIKNLFAAARWCPKATKTGIAETQPWTYLFIAVRCNICVVWINTVCIYLLFSCTPFPSTCQCELPGEQISELFNLHNGGFSGVEARCGLNVSASLNPLSKARCCWCGSSRFKGAFKVLSVQNSEYTMAV